MTHFFAYGENMASSLSGQFGRMLTYLTYPPHLPATLTEKDSLFRRQHVMEALDDSIRDQEQALAPPLWVPPQHSLLFETTTKKLYKHRSSLQKQVLLKQLYSKLQTTKRHGIIILPTPQKPTPAQTPPAPLQPSSELAYLHNAGHQRYYQRRMMPNQGLLTFPSVNTTTTLQRKRASPPSPISPPYAPKTFCNGSMNDDDDNVPLGTLIPTQHQQKQLHRIGICVI
ncbi:hypothetical protein [Absidia glauca]|uniref:Uncharacterized protein n=1 Tax=Absidia glauca TaxID=4829 RepID=A0A163JSY2_ABSGL|nr:hypothetical protein [Absidia glauca]